MDPIIIAAIITGCSTIISALIGALIIIKSIVVNNKQKIKGNNNEVKSTVIFKNGLEIK